MSFSWIDIIPVGYILLAAFTGALLEEISPTRTTDAGGQIATFILSMFWPLTLPTIIFIKAMMK